MSINGLAAVGSRSVSPVFGLALAGVVAIVAVSSESATSGTAVYALSLLLSTVLVLSVRSELARIGWSATVLTLGYLAGAILLVPFGWWIGVGQPWGEIRASLGSALSLGGLLALLYSLGIWVALRRRGSEFLAPVGSWRIDLPPVLLRRLLVVSLLVSVASFAVYVAIVGGLGNLLESLSGRRELNAGLGVLLVPQGVGLVASIVAVGALRREEQCPRGSERTRGGLVRVALGAEVPSDCGGARVASRGRCVPAQSRSVSCRGSSSGGAGIGCLSEHGAFRCLVGDRH